MKRDEFIRQGLFLGLGLPWLSSVVMSGCSEDAVTFPSFETTFSGKVIIVGAGATGMAAGYLLHRYGIDFEIVEAASDYGGRLRRNTTLADFPLDTGAEWIHTNPSVLADIINNPQSEAKVDVIVYNPQTVKTWKNGRLISHNYLRHIYSEWKFKSTTWFGFFEQWILPSVADRMRYNTPITAIDYSDTQVRLTTSDNEVLVADKVLLTVPLSILQRGSIAFTPTLPEAKTRAINAISMGDGIKIFVRFQKKFYPDFLAFGNLFSALEEEEKFVYDAAFRKDSAHHVLGLFAINEKASAYTRLPSNEAIIAQFLSELDDIFDGQASANYIDHVIQNWSAEPYIGGAYSYAFDGSQERIVENLSAPLSQKIYFAGEALSIEHQATVHGACASAYAAVETMLTAVS